MPARQPEHFASSLMSKAAMEKLLAMARLLTTQTRPTFVHGHWRKPAVRPSFCAAALRCLRLRRKTALKSLKSARN